MTRDHCLSPVGCSVCPRPAVCKRLRRTSLRLRFGHRCRVHLARIAGWLR